MNSEISFDNTEIAFAHKKNSELKQAHFLFKMMGMPWLVQLGSRLAPWSIRTGLPVKGLIRKTIFQQFVGGETLEETIPVAKKLAQYHVQVILDYGVEGKEGEENYDHARDEFIRVIQFASTQPNVPFMSIKVTGMARFGLLEKMDEIMHHTDGVSLIDRYRKALMQLNADELNEWHRVVARVQSICEVAKKSR
ncbi:MAG: proline dehydrogenase family protein, partial [Flavisolibacter sp.]